MSQFKKRMEGFAQFIAGPMFLVIALAAQNAHPQSAFSARPIASVMVDQDVTVTAQFGGTVSTVEVLTLGVAGHDFVKGTGALGCEHATLAANSTCVESVAFSPMAPGLRLGAVVLFNAGGIVLGTAYVSGTGVGSLAVFSPGNILPIAGDGLDEGSVLDGNPATAASLNRPSGVVLDGTGSMYIADSDHNRIREVDATAGIIATIAGDGDPNYTGDNGLALSATLNTPSSIAIDGAGNLYIADTGNNVVRRICAADGIITTIAGNGMTGSPTDVGDGGQATAASLNAPQGVTLDGSANLFIADTAHHRIRRVDATSGIITTVAGNGTTNPSTGAGGYSGDKGPAINAELNFPFAVAFDAAGNMYIPDSANNVVRMVNAAGVITTFAGTGIAGYSGDGHAATSAMLFSPQGVIVDPAGNLYIADTQNDAIRKVNSITANISTIAVNGSGSYIDLAGEPFPVNIDGPIGLFLDGNGNLYFADSMNMRIREIQSNFAALDFTPTPIRQGSESEPQIQTIEDDGNATLDFSAFSPDSNSALDASTTTCNTGIPLFAVGAACNLGVVFAPSVIGNPLIAQIDLASTTPNSPLQIELIGIANPVNSTTTVLASSLNPSGLGQSVTFTATVTTGATSGSLTGSVTFSVDGLLAGSSVLVTASGIATYTTSAISAGVHSVTASYAGDSSHSASTSAAVSQTVLEGTKTTLVSSLNPAAVGTGINLIATVTTLGGGEIPLEGIVVFTDITTGSILGTVPVTELGVATLSTSSLSNGNHAIIAAYSGVANQIEGSTSDAWNQDTLALSSAKLTSNTNPSSYGAPVTFTVAISSASTATASGTVTIFDGALLLGSPTLAGSPATANFTTPMLPVGSHTVTASYGGDSYNAPAQATAVVQVVNQSPSTTAISANPTPAIAGVPITITAAVKPAQALTVPTGSVTFTNAALTLGTATLAPSGTAAINATLPVGSDIIVATYSGDVNDLGSVSTPLVLPIQIATTQVVLSSSANPALVDSAITFTAAVRGDGPVATGIVTLFSDQSPIVTATLDGLGTAVLKTSALTTGTHIITAVYSGDANNAASTSLAISQVVATIPTATVLGVSIPGSDPKVALVASVTGSSGPEPTGVVTFTIGANVLGTATLNASGVATLNPILPQGTISIVAAYAGDSVHAPSTSQPATVNGAPVGFTLTVNPSSLSLVSSQNAVVTISLASINGFTDTVGLGCASLPMAVTCHFSSVSIPLTANATVTTQLTIDSNDPLSGGTSAAIANKPRGTASLAEISFPLVAFLPLALRRFRKRTRTLLAVPLLLLFCAAVTLISGCLDSFTQRSAAPGIYTIEITGSGSDGGIFHYQNVTLTVTK